MNNVIFLYIRPKNETNFNEYFGWYFITNCKNNKILTLCRFWTFYVFLCFFIFSYIVIKNESINGINYINIITKHKIYLPTNPSI